MIGTLYNNSPNAGIRGKVSTGIEVDKWWAAVRKL